MKAKTVKTKIKQLVKKMGGHEAVADALLIDLSYVYILEKGKRIPSERLYRDICNLDPKDLK